MTITIGSKAIYLAFHQTIFPKNTEDLAPRPFAPQPNRQHNYTFIVPSQHYLDPDHGSRLPVSSRQGQQRTGVDRQRRLTTQTRSLPKTSYHQNDATSIKVTD
ncbi:hypothetical protein CONLIGDRAFT_650630 [Coniochaeta ligniaria NRRL 30616]|uniref:Uncharacterized protein n=1 Tax=Coniochaeta ligniaria NRRL 30616 TaxID=1408157 RepID=A0A1J7I4Q0_9PEZI|nr:hypothetical protein CONLIGDRAFT_650630 [Coniochaeta ligniaria NRRL 30616]